MHVRALPAMLKTGLFGPLWVIRGSPPVYLFSVEQKKVTQGLVTLLSEEGGRYMASEKQVSSKRRISVLKREEEQAHVGTRSGRGRTWPADSPVQVVDVVERRRLCKPHPSLPDVFTAVY